MMLGHLLLTRVIIVVIIVYILVVIGVLLVDRLRFFSDIIVLVYDCILVCIGSHRMVLVELILLLDEEIMCRCWNLTWYQRVWELKCFSLLLFVLILADRGVDRDMFVAHVIHISSELVRKFVHCHIDVFEVRWAFILACCRLPLRVQERSVFLTQDAWLFTIVSKWSHSIDRWESKRVMSHLVIYLVALDADCRVFIILFDWHLLALYAIRCKWTTEKCFFLKLCKWRRGQTAFSTPVVHVDIWALAVQKVIVALLILDHFFLHIIWILGQHFFPCLVVAKRWMRLLELSSTVAIENFEHLWWYCVFDGMTR